ncbi:MAG: chorismate synthase [Candidatus Izimaplasma sp.]|nr:chorismate synthase [Candidatus Izimaplasma bacterium]
MSTFGKAIEITLFGESHGKSIGIVISNLPAGINLDLEGIKVALNKRRPTTSLSTPRQEQDKFEIISGYFNGLTTGSPLTFVIQNTDVRSFDYDPNILRPSHADYTSHIKYESFQDYRGGGHFSGRITAPLVILGAISSQLLAKKGITIGSHIASIKNEKDKSFTDFKPSEVLLEKLNSSRFPVLDSLKTKAFETIILNAKNNKDSVGGTIETMVLGLDAGYGDPYFESIESVVSHLIFSIPAVKAIEFGKGFPITELFGSEANDSFYIEDSKILTKTNNSGGIQGGISNGMPITFKVAIKPTPSIEKLQDTVDIGKMEEIKLSLKGRHDPAIVHRVVHVVNAVTSYAILELIVRKEGNLWIK